jgi:hypothetical protein
MAKALALAALMTFALSGVGNAIDPPTIRAYFPLHDRDQWSYILEKETEHGINPPMETIPGPIEDVRVKSSYRNEAGREVFVLSNYIFQLGSGDTQFMATPLSPEVLELSGNQAEVWYRFMQGSAISIPDFASDCIHGSLGTVIRQVDTGVPAGFFRNCLVVRYDQSPCVKAGLVKEVFAPEVGLIQRVITNSDGSMETWSLNRAQVGGRVYAPFPGDPDSSDRGAAAAPALEASSWGHIKSVYEN